MGERGFGEDLDCQVFISANEWMLPDGSVSVDEPYLDWAIDEAVEPRGFQLRQLLAALAHEARHLEEVVRSAGTRG